MVDSKMIWKKLSFEQQIALYKAALEEITIKNAVDSDMIIKGLLVRAEILKHDFTKRQMSILMGIFTYSYALYKESTYVEKLSDFSLMGIGITKIKSELIKLEDMRVLHWDRENHLFSIRDFREWDVRHRTGFSDDRARVVFAQNLEHAGVDLNAMVERFTSKD
jgi:hypothetical protein